MKTVLTAAQLFTPEKVIDHPIVIIDDRQISALGSREQLSIPAGARHHDFPDKILAPGFIDIHVHGGSGREAGSIPGCVQRGHSGEERPAVGRRTAGGLTTS